MDNTSSPSSVSPLGNWEPGYWSLNCNWKRSSRTWLLEAHSAATPVSRLGMQIRRLLYWWSDPFLLNPILVFRLILLRLMACLSDESWDSLPKMLSKSVSIKEDGEEETNACEFPFEKVFPVYAIGIPKPDSDFVLSFSNSGADPIWDTVREEAKLEVLILYFFIAVSFFFFFNQLFIIIFVLRLLLMVFHH